MRDKVLPDFQDFLISRRFATEKHVRFYAFWVSKFLVFSNKNQDFELKVKIEKFLERLASTPNIADWQKKQAQTALKLYFDHFNADAAPKLSVNVVPPLKNSCFDYAHASQAMREAIRIRHYAYKTERSYLSWVRRFYDYVSKSKNVKTQGLSSEDVRDYLSFLALRQRVSSSTQNQAFNAILFLFRNVLKIEVGDLDKTVRAKRGPKLPVVLSVEEVQELFRHVAGKQLLILQLLYGTGMRLMEIARLRVQDIDFNSNLIFVRSAKGDKDRATILPEYIKDKLQAHLEEVKKLHEKDFESGYGEVSLPDALGRKYPNASKEWGWQYVFPSAKLSVDPRSGKVRRHHISEKTIQSAVAGAVKKSGLVKHATVHTLRHSFATHLLISGVNIRQIQELLGHKNVETTMIYTHVLRDMSNAPQSPLDKLYPVRDSSP